MVYLYAANISTLPDPLENPEVMAILPKERQKKILKYKQKQNRLQSLGAGLILNRVLSRHGGAADKVQVGANGKPTVEGISFNLSHSGDLVICAVSEKPVGCDIERIKNAPQRVAERSFSEAEKEHLQQFLGEAYNREFFRIWTKKESYLKMLGTGIRVPLNELEIQDCYLKEYEIQGYQITVCAKEDKFSDLIWEHV